MKILVINGPNINMLGTREPEIYGNATYADLCDKISEHCKKKDVECEIFQSNHEGEIIDKIQSAYKNVDAIVINPAAYTHTSIAIADSLKSVMIPYVEVHLTDTDSREEFRKISYVRENAKAAIKGKGFDGYLEAIDVLLK